MEDSLYGVDEKKSLDRQKLQTSTKLTNGSVWIPALRFQSPSLSPLASDPPRPHQSQYTIAPTAVFEDAGKYIVYQSDVGVSKEVMEGGLVSECSKMIGRVRPLTLTLLST